MSDCLSEKRDALLCYLFLAFCSVLTLSPVQAQSGQTPVEQDSKAAGQSMAAQMNQTVADQNPQLQFNPFKRPGFLVAPNKQAGVKAVTKQGQLDLRAVMVAGRDSLVNISGEFYGIGDKVDGYRLVSVGEHHAVFIRNGKKLTITLKE